MPVREDGFVGRTGTECGILADQPVPLSSPVSIYKKIKEAANIYLCNVSLDLP